MIVRQQVVRLARNALTYGVGQVLNRVISFLLLPVFTAYLTPADYGIMSILALIVFVVTSVFSLGLGTATGICYFEGNSQERKETTIWTAFIILEVSVSILTLIGLVFARQISWVAFLTPDYDYLVTISLLSTCLNILVIPFMLYLQFEEKVKIFVALTAISTLVSIGSSIVMVVILERGVQGMLEGRLIAQAIGLVLYVLPVVPKLKFRFSQSLVKELLRMGVPLIPAFASLFVLQQMNKYILQRFDGLEAVGIYTVGYNLGFVMNLFVSGFTNAWYPYFMSFADKHAEARVLFGRILTYYIFGFGALSLLFYLFAKPVVMVMTQPAFHQAYKVVGLSATAQFLMGVFSLILPGMYFMKEVKYQSIVQSTAAFIVFGLNLLLIPWLGFLGAAIALALGHLVMVVLQLAWNLARKHVYLKVQYEWNRVAKFMLIYIGYLVFALWERNSSLPTEIILSCLVAASLPVILYFLLNASERRTLLMIGKQFIPKLAGRASSNI
jgi:O-antigen/teichoic acid export membrane protein